MVKVKALYQNKFIDIGANKMHYLDSGEVESGKTLVLLSGWPVSCRLFTELIEIIASSCRCIAVDLPGWGESTDCDNVFHSVEYNADVLDKFIEQVIPGKEFSILGYSTGGVIGVVYTDKYKKNDALLIYSSPLDGVGHLRNRFKRQKKSKYMFLFFKNLPALLKMVKKQPFKYVITKLMFGSVYGRLAGSTPEMDSCLGEIVSASEGLSPKAVFDIALDLGEKNFVPRLANFEQKTLFMSSANDTAVTPDEVRRFYESSKNGKLHIFDKYDHFIVLENPKVLAEVITDFLV